MATARTRKRRSDAAMAAWRKANPWRHWRNIDSWPDGFSMAGPAGAYVVVLHSRSSLSEDQHGTRNQVVA